MNDKKVLVALSGGVDSCVCVHLLKEQGYQVAGVVLKMSPAHDDTVKAAQEAADALGIELYVKDMQPQFKQEVESYFVKAYQSGITPNPCIVCNPKVKFRALIDTANEYGYYYVATGHYANLETIDGVTYLKKGDSLKRDQSYMLYRLKQDILSRLMFPLAKYEKDKVREIASALGLSCATKPDSQENCFIPDNDYAGYIEKNYGKSKKGEFISPEGKVCGQHQGIIHYTVGQRKGLGIALGRPVFITEIDPVENRIYLANSGDEYKESVTLCDMSFTFDCKIEENQKVQVKIRSMATPADAKVTMLADGRCEVVFDTPQRAPARGQSVVIYDGDTVLGGGFIE